MRDNIKESVVHGNGDLKNDSQCNLNIAHIKSIVIEI